MPEIGQAKSESRLTILLFPGTVDRRRSQFDAMRESRRHPPGGAAGDAEARSAVAPEGHAVVNDGAGVGALARRRLAPTHSSKLSPERRSQIDRPAAAARGHGAIQRRFPAAFCTAV
jgi:hypothetical protein